MTVHGWDMSHYDWDRGLTAAEIRSAAGAGIAFMTHKIGEGASYTDPRFDDFWRASRSLRDRVLLGAYYVLHPGNAASQADRFVRLLDQQAPGWRAGPFILQVDAEKFSYMDRAPNLAEIKAFVARLRAKAPAHRPVVYAPRWVYGDSLRGLGAPLWASNYGDNPAAGYRQAYPGDSSSRWVAYSGQTPALLQYGSRTKIGTQGTCDANAFRGTLAELVRLVYPSGSTTVGEDDMTPADAWRTHVNTWRIEGLRANRPIINIPARPDLGPTYKAISEPNHLATTLTALAAGAGVEQVIARMEALAAEDAARDQAAAARDAELAELVEQGQSGQLAAEDVVARIGALLSAGGPVEMGIAG